MTPLVVEVDGRVLRLEGDRTFRIGRSIEADIVVTAASASRQHAEIRPVDGGWLLVDAGSQFGTYVDGRPVGQHAITERVVVSCGPEASGSTLTIYPESEAPAEVAVPGHAPAPPPMPVGGDVPTSADPAWPHATPPPSPQSHQPPPPPSPSPSPGAPAGPAEAGFPPPGPDATPAGVPSPFAPPEEAPFPPPGQPGETAVIGQVGAGPSGAPGDPMGQPTRGYVPGAGPGPGGPMPPPSGPDLLLIAEGREHRFRHPTQLSLGRNPDSTVVLSDPAASRQHGVVTPVPGGWVYTNHSGEGTFLDGRRITSKRFDERITLRLGHPVAGPEVTLVPILSAVEEEKRIARKRRRRTLAVVGVVAAAMVLVAGVIVGSTWLFSRGDDEPSAGGGGSSETSSTDTLATLTDEELDSAKAATVRITAESSLEISPSTEVEYSGSGSIIREDGLILTNAHVAAPADPDVVDKYDTPADRVIANPEVLVVETIDLETGETEPAYVAEVVAVDGEQDAAVLHVVGDADGDELDEDPELPTVPVGESSEVELNDPVTVLGFPGIASSNSGSSSKPITVTDGKISTILDDIQEFDTTARISGGNSGGMAIDNDAALIGVPSYGTFDGRGGQSNRIKMVDALVDLIAEAEDAVD
jgi:putative serine protease PepD